MNALAKDSLEAARHKLMDILCNYQGYQKCNLILVFDAYRRKLPGQAYFLKIRITLSSKPITFLSNSSFDLERK